MLHEFIYFANVKVGDTIEYYAHEAGVGDPYNICKVNVRSILPSESLEVMTDFHLFFDGLVPITYGRPIGVEKREWFDSNNCNCIVGDDKGAIIGHVRRKLSNITKRAEEQFLESNQSKKVVNVTMHFIIKITLNSLSAKSVLAEEKFVATYSIST
jgi:hypothetical protein